jgi:hypothetical protein
VVASAAVRIDNDYLGPKNRLDVDSDLVVVASLQKLKRPEQIHVIRQSDGGHPLAVYLANQIINSYSRIQKTELGMNVQMHEIHQLLHRQIQARPDRLRSGSKG